MSQDAPAIEHAAANQGVVRAVTITSSLAEATATMLAAIATLACVLAIDPEPGPAMLAVVLCVALSRRQRDDDAAARWKSALALPVVGLAAAGISVLLLRMPWTGALVFTAGIALSIWLRKFGATARRAASFIALPFVVILTTPYAPPTRIDPRFAVLIPVIVALLALAWVGLFHALGRLVHAFPRAQAEAHEREPASRESSRESSLRPDATTRLAIQMACAIGVSFVIGYTFFPERWSWIVLTAFIVSSGNRGRLDVAYKSVLRVLGAAVGTVAAVLFSSRLGAHDAATVAMMLVAVFLGLWLRPFGYAWWALFVTLALALLQGFAGVAAPHVLWPRLEEIVIGAIIGVASAWFVLPVRSTAVLRRRIADALATLSDALDPAQSSRAPEPFLAAVARVEQIAPAFRASRRMTRRFFARHPADWIDALSACRAPALAIIEAGETPPSGRRAVGAARKAVREPEHLLAALNDLRRALTG